jgi:type II secretory pathway pseudopilin PulG
LIELLVVVSIIALLIAILLPSLKRARMQAKAVTCRTQLRGMALAMSLYSNRENDHIPLNMFKNYSLGMGGEVQRGRDYPWPVLLLPFQDDLVNTHICPAMPAIYHPEKELNFENPWLYFEQEEKLPTSYQMKPDLGSADFAPSMRQMASSNATLWARFFKYWDQENGLVTLESDSGSLISLGADPAYKLIKTFGKIRTPSRVMLFSDRWQWHIVRDKAGQLDVEARQLVFADGSSTVLPHSTHNIRSRYMLEGYWYRTGENVPIIPDDEQN